MNTLYDKLLEHQQNRQQNKKDGRRFGLVLQGGGMRGVFCAGAVAKLIENGLTNAFDHVIGSSAGAMNAAYYLAYREDIIHKIYSDDLTNKNFINLLRRDKRVDIDYLVDMVLKHKHPLDIHRLMSTPSHLHIVLTDAITGRKVIMYDHKKFAEIYEELRATAALPLLYDKKVLVQGRYYIDGGIANLIPIDVAVKLKCTDIVVVMTQQANSYHFDKRHARLVKHIVRRFAKNHTAGVKRILPSDERITQFNLRLIAHPTKKTRFYVLEPSDEDILISLATTDKPKVDALAKLGVADMDRFLHKPLP